MLESLNLIHTDLKPANIFLNFNIKESSLDFQQIQYKVGDLDGIQYYDNY